MLRLLSVLVPALVLASCAPAVTGREPGGVYRIRAGDADEIQYRMLDSINFLRREVGAAPVQLSGPLTSAAEAHAADMSRQQRAWAFGTDGTTPYDRVRRSGYPGALVAEVYSQTYETELETLAAWVEDGAWGEEILDPDATDMGFAWEQDANGLIWWVIILGDASADARPI